MSKLEHVSTTTCTGRPGDMGLPWLRLRSRQGLRAASTAMQRSPMLRRAADELCCSGSVLHGASASSVDRGLRMWVGRRCCACRVEQRTLELAQAKPTGKMGLDVLCECCSKVRCDTELTSKENSVCVMRFFYIKRSPCRVFTPYGSVCPD